MWNASPVSAPPADLGQDRRAASLGMLGASTTRTAGRLAEDEAVAVASNGRDAFSGSSLRFERAPMLASAANATGRIVDSVPPAITTSTSPCSIRRCASTKAWTPEAQAATLVITGPRSRSGC